MAPNHLIDDLASQMAGGVVLTKKIPSLSITTWTMLFVDDAYQFVGIVTAQETRSFVQRYPELVNEGIDLPQDDQWFGVFHCAWEEGSARLVAIGVGLTKKAFMQLVKSASPAPGFEVQPIVWVNLALEGLHPVPFYPEDLTPLPSFEGDPVFAALMNSVA